MWQNTKPGGPALALVTIYTDTVEPMSVVAVDSTRQPHGIYVIYELERHVLVALQNNAQGKFGHMISAPPLFPPAILISDSSYPHNAVYFPKRFFYPIQLLIEEQTLSRGCTCILCSIAGSNIIACWYIQWPMDNHIAVSI